jgi:hypothetical protein
MRTGRQYLESLRDGRCVYVGGGRVRDATGQLREAILSRDPDSGTFTRLLRFPPGTDTSPNGTLTHDCWEEVWILEGTLHDLRLDQTFGAGMYACRPPGMAHGPWRSNEGCLTFEVRYLRP